MTSHVNNEDLPRHVFLDLGKDRHDSESKTNQHVERNEELMNLALSDIVSGVVDKHQNKTFNLQDEIN